MSKQLAISSSFCTFALAAMALLYTPDAQHPHGGSMIWNVQAENINPGPLVPSLFRD